MIKMADDNDIEDLFDLLCFRRINPLDCPLSDVYPCHIGRKVWSANSVAVLSGVLTSVSEERNLAILNDRVCVSLSSCVLVN